MGEPRVDSNSTTETSGRARRAFASALVWSLGLGIVGFCAGFFGPIALTPGANQGPLLGIFITGPAGVVLGLVAGTIAGLVSRSTARAVTTPLVVASLAYGAAVLFLIQAG